MDILTANKNMPGTGAGVVVCVLDTGVNPVGRLAGKVAQVAYTDKILDHSDNDGHGTFCASEIIDLCPDARILSYRVLPNLDPGYINLALKEIIARVKADKTRRYVLSLSLTGEGDQTIGVIADMYRLMTELVEMNVPICVAAGNDGIDPLGNRFPSCFDVPICVGAVDNEGKHAGFSTHHGEVDFGEVGVAVPGLTLDGKTDKWCGTSMATPIVAAKCAKMLSLYPSITEPELFEALKANALDLNAAGFDPYTGWGWIASVSVAPTPPSEPDKPSIGGKLTAAQLVAYFQLAVAEGWGYVWSLNGELYTRELAEYYHKIKRDTNKNRDPKTYWLTDCARWIGKMAADCSGGIVGAIRTVDPSYIDRTANLFFAQCTDSGKISTIPEIPGLCVWRDGHIGIYEGNGNVLEFRGTDYGAVRTKLKDRNFTHWGRLGDIKYNTEDIDMAKVIRITSPIVYDADVQALQAALNALGYDCGTADGKAGAKTMAGIAAFCEAHGAAGEVVEVPAELPNALTLAVEIGGKKYALEVKAV